MKLGLGLAVGVLVVRVRPLRVARPWTVRHRGELWCCRADHASRSAPSWSCLSAWRRWAAASRHLLRRNAGLVVVYGMLAVAGAQYCFFAAVQRMDVGPALLIEYTAPAAVVGWMWARHRQRPTRLTVAGAVIAGLGLVLVLDVFSGVTLDGVGVAWALAAMVGCATYFIVNGDDSTGLPPLALAAGGLVVGAVGLGALGLVGVLPLSADTRATSGSPTRPCHGGSRCSCSASSPPPGAALCRRDRRFSAAGVSTGLVLVAVEKVYGSATSAGLLLDQLPAAVQPPRWRLRSGSVSSSCASARRRAGPAIRGPRPTRRRSRAATPHQARPCGTRSWLTVPRWYPGRGPHVEVLGDPSVVDGEPCLREHGSHPTLIGTGLTSSTCRSRSRRGPSDSTHLLTCRSSASTASGSAADGRVSSNDVPYDSASDSDNVLEALKS